MSEELDRELHNIGKCRNCRILRRFINDIGHLGIFRIECGGSGQSVTLRTVQDRIRGLGAERSRSVEQAGETERLLGKVMS